MLTFCIASTCIHLCGEMSHQRPLFRPIFQEVEAIPTTELTM